MTTPSSTSVLMYAELESLLACFCEVEFVASTNNSHHANALGTKYHVLLVLIHLNWIHQWLLHGYYTFQLMWQARKIRSGFRV
jgi:hypothetical protein